MSVRRQVWIYLAVLAVVGAVCAVALRNTDQKEEDEASDYDELEPCRTLTSYDSKRSLYLSRSHQARFSDKSGLAVRWDTGTWALVDEDAHRYRIKVDGKTSDYTLVTAPAGEGCMLAAGKVEAADLRDSWFSALTDPKD